MTRTQHTEHRFEPSLVRNGIFSEGLAHWFGSYLRHNKSDAQQIVANAPTYVAELARTPTTDQLNGIPRGLNQFIDVPELYSYPAKRVAANLRVKPIGTNTALIAVSGDTRVNGSLLAPGDVTAIGVNKYFQHPFVYRDEAGALSIESGAPVSIASTYARQTGQYLAGVVVFDTTSSNTQEVARHVLIASKITDIAPEISGLTDAPGTTCVVNNPGNIGGISTGVGSAIFTGGNIPNLFNFVRPDGAIGIKSGDMLVLDDLGYQVEITGVSSAITAIGEINITYSNTPGADGIPSSGGGNSTEWRIFAVSLASAKYEMPLYLYDFTFGATYYNAGSLSVPPGPVSLEFRGSDGFEINGIGDVVETINAVDSQRVDVILPDIQGASWYRRLEYLRKEVRAPLQARMLLNIQPPAPLFLPRTAEVSSVVYDAATDIATLEYFIPAEEGTRIASATWDLPSRQLTLVGVNSFNTNVGDTLWVTGRYDDQVGADWLTDIVESYREIIGGNILTRIRIGYQVVSNDITTNTLVLQIPVSLGITDDTPATVTGLATTSLRVTNFFPTQRIFFEDYAISLRGDIVEGQEWVLALFDSVLSVVSRNILSDSTDGTVMELGVAWPVGTAPSGTVAQFSSTLVEMGVVSQFLGDTAEIGDISLWKGFKYHRLNVADVANVNAVQINDSVSLDPLISNIDTTSALVPKGFVVLYAGGGTCPSGYKPVRSFAESGTTDPGLKTIYQLPWPDNTVYSSDHDVTVLSWDYIDISQKDTEGNPLLVDSPSRYAIITVPIEGGEDLLVQVSFDRAKQLIEPGMILRVKDQEYEVGTSSVVDSGTFDEIDYFAPYEGEDSGFLVSDVSQIVSGEEITYDSAEGYRNPYIISPVGTTEFSTFGGGRGEITYPSLVGATFNSAATIAGPSSPLYNTYPNLPPHGPQPLEQTEVFSTPAGYTAPVQPYAYMRIVDFLQDGPLPGQGNHRLEVEDLTDTRYELPGFAVDGVDVTVANNAFNTLRAAPYQGSIHEPRGGDVYFARMYVWTGTVPYNNKGLITTPIANSGPLGQGVDVSDIRFHDAFYVSVQIDAQQGADWNVFRYDVRSVKLLGLGGPNYRSDIVQAASGQENRVLGGYLVLQPAKLYGAPDVRQTQQPALPAGALNQTPQGVGQGFDQSKSTFSSQSQWLTRFVSVSLAMTVTGELTRPSSSTEYLYAEPSGYLRYDDSTTGMDYGASGHVHLIQPQTDLRLEDSLPRTASSISNQYVPVRLPENHGHGSLGELVYPMPRANIFTLCLKL